MSGKPTTIPHGNGWNLDTEIAFLDGLAANNDRLAIRGYIQGLQKRTYGFVDRTPINEGARGQLLARARVHLIDLTGRAS